MEKILKDIFGFSSFRPGQKEIITSIINGNNVLAVLPTGGGKSLCYQMPAILSKSFSIVISPLIALMKDQVDGLNKKKETAAYINSTMNYGEIENVLRKIESGKIKLLYVSPERLENIQFVERIKILSPEYIFVDEAHCISEWGHNFRPSYRKIINFAEKIDNTKISAFTATAVPEVRRDIIEHFNFTNPRVFIKGFARNNLRLNVIHTSQKKETVLKLVTKNRLPAVIYTSTRKRAEELAEYLRLNNQSAAYYHAGLQPEQRRMIQDDFMNDRVKIICATNAFGMGVDKADIRLLIHNNMPASLENYYQEIGRAGRDGKTAKIFLLYEEKDFYVQEYFINNSYPTLEEIKTVYNLICNAARIAVGSRFERRIFIDKSIEQILNKNNLNRTKLYSALQVLDSNGLVDFISDKISYSFVKILANKEQLRIFITKFTKELSRDLLIYFVRQFGNSVFSEKIKIDINFLSGKLQTTTKETIDSLNKLANAGIIEFTLPSDTPSIKIIGERIAPEKLRINVEHHLNLKENAKLKLNMMKNYAFTNDCRFKFILNYFGEETAGYSCGKCDNCTGKLEQTTVEVEYLEEIIVDTLHHSSDKMKEINLIKTLTGDNSKNNLNNYNFGVCSHFSNSELTQTITALIAKQILKRNGTVLEISEIGRDIFALPAKNRKEEEKQNRDYNLQLEILNKLKELRKRTAKKFSQPEQVICGDEILREIANTLPSSPSKLLAIKGFNPRMFNKIGEDILEIILEHKLKNRDKFEKQKKTQKKKTIPENLFNTLKLLQEKKSLEQIASILQLPETVISMQVESILEFYPDTDITSIIKKHEIELIEKEITKGLTEIKDIKDALPPFITYPKIRIVLAKHFSAD